MQTKIQGFRLSPQQRLLWKLNEESPEYLTQAAVLIDGKLNEAHLKSAIKCVISKHQIFRTQFRRLPGMKKPVQVISENQEFGWEKMNLSADTSEETDTIIQKIFLEERKNRFDLEEGPVLRFKLLKDAADRHFLIISLPALCGDSQTIKNLVQEISEFYTPASSRNPEQVAQYIQFSEWQNQLLESENAEDGLAFWTEQNIGNLPPLQLPVEKPVKEVLPFEPQTLNFKLKHPLFSQIEEISQKYEASPAIFLLTCFQTLLWRFTGDAEITIGSICDGRTFEMLENACGVFAKTLPLRTAMEKGTPFSKVLSRVRENSENIEGWQEFFAWDGREQPDSESPKPLFSDIIFEFTDSSEKYEAEEVSFSVYQLNSFINHFKVNVSTLQLQDTIAVNLHYNPHYFDTGQMEQLVRCYLTLINSAAANPDDSIENLEILSEFDRRILLVDFNRTEAEYPENQTIHGLFEEQVRRIPGQPAVVFEDQHLTYAELNARTNQLAFYLRQQKVGPDVRVALCVDRSLEMMVGILAILKAGGAYVPLNPDHPQSRLEHQIREIETPVILTQEAFLDNLPEFAGQVICLDRDTHLWKDQSPENPPPVNNPNHSIYVIYTSGSTGIPKGVILKHRNLVNYSIFLTRRLLRLSGKEERGLHFATVSTITADLGNTCIFGSLVSGGCLHILSYDVTTDGHRFAEYLSKHPVDVLKIVPSHMNALLPSRPENARILPRKFLIMGGEAFSFELFDKLSGIAGNCEIINHYGPTEATIGCIANNVTRNGVNRELSATIPIGRPISNMQAFILDENQKPVPLGVPGELCIGGTGLAVGYLKQPERTAERFIRNPFSDNPDSRLYRTGDLVRYLKDGNIEFLGRTDNQVKIRGFRVELEEIEVILGQHPDVRQAVVIVREDEPGDKKVVAYVVAEPTSKPGINELYEYLKNQLPDFMVPSAFVLIDELPLTPNGKVDRKALPAPDTFSRSSQKSFIAPRTPVEELLAGILAKVLNLEKVGINDNFFALGGHSLLAMKVVARIREAFGIDLPLRNLFESPTVAKLATEIEQARQAKDKRPAPSIVPVPKNQEIPLSFSQQRLWFLDQLIPGSSFYNVPSAMRLSGDLKINILKKAINEIVRRHEILRTIYKTVDGQPVQVIAGDFLFNLPVIDLQSLSDEEKESEARQLAISESRQPFNLSEGPLFRIKLVKLFSRHHILFYTTHHIVSDVWSRGVLIQEVAVLYEAFLNGRPSPLPELPVQYADYAFWQRNWLQQEVLEEQISYWKNQLEGSPALINLPTDFPRPPVQSFRGADKSLSIPQELSKSLIDFSRKEGLTPFMILLAAFQTLLYRYARQEIINVGSPIAGRSRPETQGMIGFFLNSLIFKADFSGNPTFKDFLRQVRETSLEAFAHQDLPFEQLVEALQPERNMSHAPLFQVSFVMMNAMGETLELPGLKIEPFKVEDKTARYDITLFMIEGENGFTANIEYCTDLFEESTISRMLQHYSKLLESIMADPNRRVSELPLMEEAEIDHLLNQLNDTDYEYPEKMTIHSIFENQVQKSPEAVALIFEDRQLDYQELNRRANRFAHFLRAIDVDLETPVAICMDRSLEMMIAILGILKAGGFYIPMDPAYPPDRLEYMLEDSRAKVLISQEHLLDIFRKKDPTGSNSQNGTFIHDGCRFLVFENIQDELLEQDAENPQIEIDENNIAYVIYTSGSTGRPKGAMISHKAICNHMLWLRDHFQLKENDVYLQKTAFSFDAAGTEFYAPLFTGGCLVLPRAGSQQDSSYLVDMMRRHQVTILQLVPSLLRMLVDEPAFENCRALRRMISAGEALPAALQQRFNKMMTAELHNFYGPTEAAVDVTFWPHQHSNDRHIVPIGRPLSNTRVYLLDSGFHPVPAGVPGELFIGGVQLARGYYQRPDLTAETFVPDGVSGKSGSRLYRTGDLARYMADGNIEFLGRVDHQVKLRGFRIELGEIEAILNQHSQVKEAVVITREDTPGDMRLIAYLVARQQPAPSVNDLRSWLKESLPEYMIPSHFVFLDTIPLTPNGKVDRRALPVPDKIRPDLESRYVAPRNPVEEKITEIGTQLLKLEKIGVMDSFFELGGHSLLATQFISRLRDTFQIDIPLRILFERPTIADLAEEIQRLKESGSELQQPAIKRVSREERRAKRSELS